MRSRHRPRHAARKRVPPVAGLVALALVAAAVVGWRVSEASSRRAGEAAGRTRPLPSDTPPATGVSSPAHSPPSAPRGSPAIVTPGPINTSFPGLTTFRGNATRDYYGEGPVPLHPKVIWAYPETGGLCSQSSDQFGQRTWCGTGWTGQPNVIVHDDGSVEVRIGAYDGHYHFLDGRTGEPVRPDLVTGDLAKGSASSDPDGYPLYYAGSRDNLLRIVALDRKEPTVLWSVDANTSVPRPMWNNDWDGAALVVDGYLLEGGENSWFYVIRLNRGYNAQGKVTVHPKIVATIPGFDDQLLAALPDTDVSIENSVAFSDGIAYFANSGGLVQGWDISKLLAGGTQYHRVFRFWTGDDTDASVVIDPQGYLYVGSEYQRFNERSREVGQLMKLDPRNRKDPVVWSLPAPEIGFEGAGGTWSTPALYGDFVYWATAAGRVLEIRKSTGKIVWETQIGIPSIASPVVVDGVLIQGDCTGALHAWDVSDPREVRNLWTMHFPGCVESTPAVWHGWLYFGTRAGQIYGVADPSAVGKESG